MICFPRSEKKGVWLPKCIEAVNRDVTVGHLNTVKIKKSYKMNGYLMSGSNPTEHWEKK